MLETGVLTHKHIFNLMRALKSNDGIPTHPLIYINSEAGFKLPEVIEVYGAISEKEFEIARKRKDGFIKNARGVKLYLSRYIKF